MYIICLLSWTVSALCSWPASSDWSALLWLVRRLELVSEMLCLLPRDFLTRCSRGNNGVECAKSINLNHLCKLDWSMTFHSVKLWFCFDHLIFNLFLIEMFHKTVWAGLLWNAVPIFVVPRGLTFNFVCKTALPLRINPKHF